MEYFVPKLAISPTISSLSHGLEEQPVIWSFISYTNNVDTACQLSAALRSIVS
jgi:hypothetical protein